ncbi:Cenp-O kinetochore centromere component-domain-containing protein [Endogone sp. FLAS-F59071]|nr:Cenp-O kinetochore centromere component-domain-containing protein [Endogone sp. FLAS-F59071]|eukprot:RUS19757.1 Cenp-O kinetochore centromere component-domain-containing protein [Endogone sp. FLAS-F59071]
MSPEASHKRVCKICFSRAESSVVYTENETIKEEIERLKNELQRQHKRREDVKRAIAEEEATTSLTRIISNSLNGPAATNDKALEDFQEQLVQDIIAGCKERQITELQTYYRLSGRTIFPVKDHHVGVRFETFYGGKYHEPYYLILKMDISTDRLVVAKHTIPHFIPLRSLEKQYLNTDMDALTKSLDDHLQAYISRREQVKALRVQQEDRQVTVMANAAFNFVEIMAVLTDRTIQINLIYDPLTTTYPARLAILERVDVMEDEGDDTEEEPRVVTQKRRLRSKEAVFRELRLPEAFERAFDGGEEGEEMEMEEEDELA